MKVTVRPYGTWRQRFPGYEPAEGMEVAVPEVATVRDLVAVLGIPDPREVVVIAEGRVLRPGDRLRPRVPVNLMAAVHGG